MHKCGKTTFLCRSGESMESQACAPGKLVSSPRSIPVNYDGILEKSESFTRTLRTLRTLRLLRPLRPLRVLRENDHC